MKASQTPSLFVPDSKKPHQDPEKITKQIEEEMKLSAPSDEIFDQLKIHYSKIRSRVIESTKKFRYSQYRLRLSPDQDSRSRDIRKFIQEVVRRQAVGCSINLGVGALLVENVNGAPMYRHWHPSQSNR